MRQSVRTVGSNPPEPSRHRSGGSEYSEATNLAAAAEGLPPIVTAGNGVVSIARR